MCMSVTHVVGSSTVRILSDGTRLRARVRLGGTSVRLLPYKSLTHSIHTGNPPQFQPTMERSHVCGACESGTKRTRMIEQYPLRSLSDTV